MLGARQEIASLQSDFYRNKFRKTLRKLIVAFCLIVILIGVIIYLVLFKAPPKYYATTTEGQIIPLVVSEK